MIDPRVKGFLIRLCPSLLVAAGVSFCLFAIMTFLVSDDQLTEIAPIAKYASVIEVRPPEDTIVIRADVVETLPRSYFIKDNTQPSESKFSIAKDIAFETSVPFEKIERIEGMGDISMAMVPILDRDAILLAASSPIYPYKAEKAGIEGHVVVAMNVDAEGKVDDVWVVEASPAGYFEDQALRAAKKFKYRPRVENGKKVLAANLIYRWDFNLPEDSDS